HGARAEPLARGVFADDRLAGRVAYRIEGGASIDGDPGLPGPLHGLRAEDLGAALGHLLEHLVGELGQVARVGDGAGIGRIHAVNVTVYLAARRLEGGGERDGGRVRAAPAERRYLALVAHALVAGDDDDLAALELVLDAVRAHLDDPGVEVAIIREDA